MATVQPAPALAADDTPRQAAPKAAEQLKKLPGGAVLRLSPGARIELGRPLQLQLGAGPAKTVTQSVSLLSGRVEVEVPVAKTPTTAVLIRGPHRVSAVAKGGQSVVIAGAGRVTVAALSGEMLAASGNDWRPMGSGVVREFAGGAASDHAVMAAPQVSLSVPIALSVAGSNVSVSASATPVPHAIRYDFSVWQVQNQDRALLQRLSSRDGSLALSDLPPGNYAVSARAVEPSGLEGAESPLVPLRVVAAELPDGGRLIEGGVSLPGSRRVRLLGTEGIEISYGTASHFVPAPSSIGVIRGEPTLVRLRAVGSTREVALTLEPRLVRARIQIGPTRASWPRDEIAVAIRLTDARGRPVSGDVQVQPSVLVNVTPTPLEWKRANDLLSAVVPKPAESGPWVVRVQVADDTGSVVGHDFLEVALDTPKKKR